MGTGFCCIPILSMEFDKTSRHLQYILTVYFVTLSYNGSTKGGLDNERVLYLLDQRRSRTAIFL